MLKNVVIGVLVAVLSYVGGVASVVYCPAVQSVVGCSYCKCECKCKCKCDCGCPDCKCNKGCCCDKKKHK